MNVKENDIYTPRVPPWHGFRTKFSFVIIYVTYLILARNQPCTRTYKLKDFVFIEVNSS